MSALFQKSLFASVAALLGLGALELGALGIEAVWPKEPLRPLPAPGEADCMPDCMPGVAQLPAQPTGLPRGIPMTPHGRRAWALPPNTEMVETHVRVRVNQMALRGPDLGPKPAEEVRLMTLGDSSVFGFGVEEDAVFGAVAAQRLSALWEQTTVSVNGGTPGYTSVQSLHTLQDVGAQVQPDLVVIATIWSDLFQTDDPVERAGGQRHPLALYRVGTRVLAPFLSAPTVGWTEGEVGAVAPGRTARVGIDRYQQTLDTLVREIRGLGAEPVVMVLPAPVDLDQEPLPALISAYREAMKSVAKTHDLVLVDGPAVFRRSGAGNAYFFDQVHPSAEGHALLGEALAEALRPHKPSL
jgi:lysophospholipase L1-like esterase